MYKNVMLVLILLLLSACGLFGSYYEPEPIRLILRFMPENLWHQNLRRRYL